MKNVLIVTYYWPPGAGPGVFRWLQLSKYLCRNGIDTHVLTVNPKFASYYQIDHTNTNKVADGVTVHYADAIDPINLVQRLKKTNKPRQFNTVSKTGILSRISNFIRSNLFVPDTRKGWNKFAISKALEIIDDFQIENVITTSPPHSSQLIGLAIKKRRSVKWIADFRDPWVDIFYSREFLYTKRTKRQLSEMELSVLNGADQVITVSNQLASLFKKRMDMCRAEVRVLPNGFDREILLSAKNSMSTAEMVHDTEQINITYTGTITDIYKPDILFRVLRNMSVKNKIYLNFIGTVSEGIKSRVNEYGLERSVNYLGTMDHQSALAESISADILLLVIPESSGDKGILTGKLFEYLALDKPILGIGPKDGDAARIINETSSGKFFDRNDDSELTDFLSQHTYLEMNPDYKAIDNYDREKQAIFFAQEHLN